MSNEEIKDECDLMYTQIRNAEVRLQEIRATCKHEKTFEGNWSYRIGSIQPAIICYYCGILIKYK